MTTRNAIDFEKQPGRDQYKTIGWGINNPQIKQDIVNLQKSRIPKPTVKYLDSVKSSNFLNFLHTKKNELLTNEKQDYCHPSMFYLTGDQSRVRNFQQKEYPVIKADLQNSNILEDSHSLKKTQKRRVKQCASVPTAIFQIKTK